MCIRSVKNVTIAHLHVHPVYLLAWTIHVLLGQKVLFGFYELGTIRGKHFTEEHIAVIYA